MNQKITTSNYDFEGIRTSNSFYADKTDFFYKLATTYGGCFFLSRPRRFGKSLTLSTLKCLFQGRRELFEGLKIDSMNYDWQEYPVVHLNMASISWRSGEAFTQSLRNSLKGVAAQLQLNVDLSATNGDIFKEILFKSAAQSQTGKVVLLIDEYDAPLVNNLEEDYLEEIRRELEEFYIQIKHANDILRFTFMTGVTRFSKVSIFSKLNHMKDLTLHPDYATMLGYTQAEVEHYFGERIEELAVKRGRELTQFKEAIRRFYNGFCFFPDTPTLYNPVSIGEFLDHGFFSNYWMATGNPKHILRLLKESNLDFAYLTDNEVSVLSLDTFDLYELDAQLILMQSGYLTIESSRETDLGIYFKLRFPNSEVEESFKMLLLAVLEYKYNKSAEEAIKQIKSKGYFEPYLGKGKPIHLLGLNFNEERRNIGEEDWVEEVM